jgi:hypothetical protein
MPGEVAGRDVLMRDRQTPSTVQPVSAVALWPARPPKGSDERLAETDSIAGDTGSGLEPLGAYWARLVQQAVPYDYCPLRGAATTSED